MSPNIKAPGRNKRHQAFLHVAHLDSIFEINHKIISRSIIHAFFGKFDVAKSGGFSSFVASTQKLLKKHGGAPWPPPRPCFQPQSSYNHPPARDFLPPIAFIFNLEMFEPARSRQLCSCRPVLAEMWLLSCPCTRSGKHSSVPDDFLRHFEVLDCSLDPLLSMKPSMAF
jgi:hypothetical protein